LVGADQVTGPARILHLHSTFNLGGKEARAVQLMHHFGREANHVILSSVPDAMGARSEIKPAINVEFPGDAAPALYGKPAPARYVRLARYMQQFDLVLSYNWGSMDGVMAHRLLSPFMQLPPLIHHEDGFNEDEIEKLNWKRNSFRKQALKGAYALVVPSQKLRGIAIRHWGFPPSPSGDGTGVGAVRITQRPPTIPTPTPPRKRRGLVFIPNGIDIARYQKQPLANSFPGLERKPGDIVVGTIAGLRAIKNLPRLVRAVAAAGPHVCLAIAGEGPERAAIMAEAERLGMADRLVMPGFLTEPARYIGHFDIFALSSDSEQFPISLVEAMAAGLPALSTDVGDVRNMVSHANRPFVVAKADDAGFAAALQRLASDGALRAEIGEANRSLAIAHNDEVTMFARYRQLYGNAMKRADFARQS
jgi:L-malate glycosyltransferase